jgi:hypothetical protein
VANASMEGLLILHAMQGFTLNSFLALQGIPHNQLFKILLQQDTDALLRHAHITKKDILLIPRHNFTITGKKST